MLRTGCNYFVIISAILLTAVLAVQPALAVVGIDANVPKDQNTASTTVATAAFSTKSGMSCCWRLSRRIISQVPTLR